MGHGRVQAGLQAQDAGDVGHHSLAICPRVLARGQLEVGGDAQRLPGGERLQLRQVLRDEHAVLAVRGGALLAAVDQHPPAHAPRSETREDAEARRLAGPGRPQDGGQTPRAEATAHVR